LDERLVDLQREGWQRDAAIQQALGEFGDAAGMAAQFSLVSQRRYRRWMMRMATASVTSAFMVIVLFVSFWPAGGRVALAPPSTAQDSTAQESAAGEDPATRASSGDQAVVPLPEEDPFTVRSDEAVLQKAAPRPASALLKNATTRTELERVMSPNFNGLSILGFANLLSELVPFGCLVDRASLENEGVDPDSGDIHWALANETRLATMLEIVLDELEMTYRIQDGILILTTRIAAEDNPSLVVYDARHLFGAIVVGDYTSSLRNVAAMYAGMPVRKQADDKYSLGEFIDALESRLGLAEENRQYSRVVTLLMAQVDPDSWEDNGGRGTISGVDQRLIVRQTERTHRKIRQLLDDLAVPAN
jgi:hypothetical protein